MAIYTFRFHFPNLDGPRQVAVVKTYGGNMGTALNRAWMGVRTSPEYIGIKGLRPASIQIDPPTKGPKRKDYKSYYDYYQASRKTQITTVGGV